MAKDDDKAPEELVRTVSLALSVVLSFNTKESVPAILERANVFATYIRKGSGGKD